MSIDLFDLYERLQAIFPEIPWSRVLPLLLMAVTGFFLIKAVIAPAVKLLARLCAAVAKRRFIKRSLYEDLSFMQSSDVYYAINQYVPTRYSARDPGNAEEPVPEETAVDARREREPLLLEHFLNYEYDIKHGGKYYLCLGDCGMGKTTFLINLYYRTLRQKKYSCRFVALSEPNCMEKIKAIRQRGKTILLLDALDENDGALGDYDGFIEKLEWETKDFYRVILTARTNFFVNASQERLSQENRSVGTRHKLSNCAKYYIAPFTDGDIKRFLKLRFRLQPRKRREAWSVIEQNKNLSVRPVLLHYIEELIEKREYFFDYDFQLYECLFRKWIERERGSIEREKGKNFYAECVLLAKQIYYQWMKSGRTGIDIGEFERRCAAGELKFIRLKGHALLNRTSDGMYKFSHKSFWEFLLARLALSDVFFADEMVLDNTVHSFDRAACFVDEMIRHHRRAMAETPPEAAAGMAVCLLKCRKPEEAEEMCRLALSKLERVPGENETLRLFVRVKLARCLWQQIREKSAGELLGQIEEELSQVELTAGNLRLFAEFGDLLAEYCKAMCLRKGQRFLQKILEFCEGGSIVNYDLLRCYEAYCRCCANNREQQEAVAEMEKLVTVFFQNDQYAEYLLLSAKSWRMRLGEQRTLYILQEIAVKYSRFMDAYHLMTIYGDVGISMYAYWGNAGSFLEHEEEAIGWLTKGCEVCCSVYEDTDIDEFNNPYIVKLYEKVINAKKNSASSRRPCTVHIAKDIQNITEYINRFHRNDEMKVFYCNMLGRAGMNPEETFERRKVYLLKQLDCADNNQEQKISAHWNLFCLYNDADGYKEEGQKHLKAAYELALGNPDYHMTRSYCNIQQVMLDFYEGELDRKRLARTLMEITPQIYGTDSRRRRIYNSLRIYFSDTGDAGLPEVCRELLLCEISRYGLKDYYDACVKYEPQRFALLLEYVMLEKPEWKPEEFSAVEEFLEEEKFSDEDKKHIRQVKNKIQRGLRAPAGSLAFS